MSLKSAEDSEARLVGGELIWIVGDVQRGEFERHIHTCRLGALPADP